MGMGLYPQFCFLFNVSGGRIQVCGLLSRCWMVDSYFSFVSVCRQWMGRGCLVWWSVEFVFRNVDGTGIFSVLLYPMFWIMYRYMSMSSVGMVLAVEVGLNDGFDSMSVFIIQPS